MPNPADIREEYDNIEYLFGNWTLANWYYNETPLNELAQRVTNTTNPFLIVAFTPPNNDSPGLVTAQYNNKTATFNWYGQTQPTPEELAEALITDWQDIFDYGTIDEYLNR